MWGHHVTWGLMALSTTHELLGIGQICCLHVLILGSFKRAAWGLVRASCIIRLALGLIHLVFYYMLNPFLPKQCMPHHFVNFFWSAAFSVLSLLFLFSIKAQALLKWNDILTEFSFPLWVGMSYHFHSKWTFRHVGGKMWYSVWEHIKSYWDDCFEVGFSVHLYKTHQQSK